MNKLTIIIEIEEQDLTANLPFIIRAQMVRNGQLVTKSQVEAAASRIYNLIGTWLAAHKNILVP